MRGFVGATDATNDGKLVLNADMTRLRGFITPSLLALAAALTIPAAAPAAVSELGAMAAGVRGSCPDAGVTPLPVPAREGCHALVRTTAYQAKLGPDRTLFQAPASGRIVAWTVAPGKPGPKQTAFFQDRYGDQSQVALVVLEPGKKLSRRVVAKSPLMSINDYFGTTVQFPLERTLPIKKGQYVGITVATWAPLMQIGLATDSSWRSSRATNDCNDLVSQSALLGGRTSTTFGCLYRGVRLAYSATFISNPVAPASR